MTAPTDTAGRVCRVCGGPGALAWADGFYCGGDACWQQRTWGLNLTPPKVGEVGTCGGTCRGVADACYDCRCPSFRPWVKPPVPQQDTPLAARALGRAAQMRRERAMAADHPDVASVTEPRVQLARDARPTSVSAALAALPRSGTQRRRVLDAILDAHDRGHTGATDPELQRHLTLPANSQRPRRVELVDAGLVFDSGRTRHHDGRAHVVWAPTRASMRMHAQPTTEE